MTIQQLQQLTERLSVCRTVAAYCSQTSHRHRPMGKLTVALYCGGYPGDAAGDNTVQRPCREADTNLVQCQWK